MSLAARARTRSSQEGGWVLIPAVILMTLLLGLGLATLSIVDTQTSASAQERADSVSFTTAEGIARSAALVLGSSEHWQGSASRTRAGSTASCGSAAQTYTDSADNKFGRALRDVVAQGYGDDAGAWKVNICRVAAVDEAWDDGHLSRDAFAATTDPLRDLLWVRAQTSRLGADRAVTLKVRATRVPLPLPTANAVITGSLGTSDVRSTTGTLLSTGDSLLGIVGGLLNDGDSLIEDDAAKLAVRCGLLHVLSGQICLTGTLAQVAGTVDMLGLSPLNDILGTNRFTQESAHSVATAEQLEGWKAEAESTGTYVANRAAGGECFSPADQAGKVVWIDVVGDGTNRCEVTSTRRAKVLVVRRGRVRVTGNFTGVLYVANRENDATEANPFGTPHVGSPPRESVLIANGGHVRGAVFVDGSGTTQITLPNVNCGLLGLNCILGSVLNLLGLMPDYTAITRDTSVIAAASPTTASGSAMVPGGFSQVPSN